jgi:hypothetical protein
VNNAIPPRERREAERFPLWAGAWIDGSQGVSRDVSKSGAYVFTAAPLAVGQSVTLKFALQTPQPGGALLVCEGCVTRVESEQSRHGVAVRFEQVHLEVA